MDPKHADIYASFLEAELRRLNELRESSSISESSEIAEFLAKDTPDQLVERAEAAVFLLRQCGGPLGWATFSRFL